MLLVARVGDQGNVQGDEEYRDQKRRQRDAAEPKRETGRIQSVGSRRFTVLGDKPQ